MKNKCKQTITQLTDELPIIALAKQCNIYNKN